MKEKPILLASWIMCPDGTMLPSFNRHDYREHVTIDSQEKVHPEGKEEPDISEREEWSKWNKECEWIVKESRFSMIDGGSEPFGRRGGVYTEMSVYSNDPFEVIRRFLCRGGRGVNSDQHLTWTPLFRINDNWLESLIEYCKEKQPSNKFLEYYIKELEYRKENNIFVEGE